MQALHHLTSGPLFLMSAFSGTIPYRWRNIEPDQHMHEYLHCIALNISFLGWSVLQSLDLPAFHLLA